MRTAILLAITALAACGADNTLTPEEKSAGWKLLFDGKTMNGWRDPASETPPGDSWEIENGCLKTRLNPRIAEDLISAESYGDFELVFDWRIAPGGNSGVKYRIQRTLFLDQTKLQKGEGGFEGEVAREVVSPKSDRAHMAREARGYEYVFGFEFQLLDDGHNPEGKLPTHRAGALYSMIAPKAEAARPAGEWNQSRLAVKGVEVRHWINGVLVMEGKLDDPAAQESLLKRWGKYPEIARMYTEPRPRGPVSLQHHGSEVWFRNIKIRPAEVAKSGR